MSSVEQLLKHTYFSWKGYFLDAFVALGSTFSLTGFIFSFHLYPQIPDISFAYLLVILALASWRGLYPALLASVSAFLSFDFFFVPPVHSLFINKFDDILMLVVFLITAIITSRLASALRRRAEEANRREREARILYDLVRITNGKENMELALSTFVRAMVQEFFRWGVQDCMLFLPNADGVMIPQTDAQVQPGKFTLSSDEEQAVKHVVEEAVTIDFLSSSTAHYDTHSSFKDATYTRLSLVKLQGRSKGECISQGRTFIRLVPLKTGQKVLGVLRLLMTSDSLHQNSAMSLGLENQSQTPQALFFSTFLEQATAIIERGRLQQENVQMKVLQQTDALRAALLSSVSHDLRTPLSTIKASATSLLEENIDWDEQTRQSFVRAIVRETDRLNGLVENLLDMSRIEAGQLHPEKVWYPLDELILDVLDRMQGQLHGRSVQARFPDDLPPVKMDSVLIDQVVTNLLENAIYHTPPETPIEVSTHLQDDYVQVCVADRGPGISPSEYEHIFDKFYRMLDQAHTYNPRRRSGLGLSICRGLVEAHAGTIWVEQRAGGGACFCFTLPLTRLEETKLYD